MLQGSNLGGYKSVFTTKDYKAFHSTPIGGHFGILATYQRIKQLFA